MLRESYQSCGFTPHWVSSLPCLGWRLENGKGALMLPFKAMMSLSTWQLLFSCAVLALSWQSWISFRCQEVADSDPLSQSRACHLPPWSGLRFGRVR